MLKITEVPHASRSMPQVIDLKKACSAICPYCKMGMPLEGNVHIRPFGQFTEAGTDDHYPCRAAKLRNLAG